MKSHKGNLDLKFDWDNLFLSCKHCNNTKGDRFDNILNCMDEDVEDCISCGLDSKNMRDNLSSQLTEFKRTIIDFLNSTDENYEILERKVINELADTFEYAAFKRCYIKNDPKLNSIFSKYIPKRK